MIDKQRKFESVFCGDEDCESNANLDWSLNPIDLYAIGYKDAGNKLVKLVLKNVRDQDILIYPIVFLYRQYVELRLKEIIKEGLIYLEEGNDFPQTHDIWDLWCKAKIISIKVFGNETESPELDYSEHVIKEFSQIDPDSFTFRYPTNKQGDRTLGGLTHINIQRLAKHIEGLSKDLEGISTGISVYREYQQEMQSSCY